MSELSGEPVTNWEWKKQPYNTVIQEYHIHAGKHDTTSILNKDKVIGIVCSSCQNHHFPKATTQKDYFTQDKTVGPRRPVYGYCMCILTGNKKKHNNMDTGIKLDTTVQRIMYITRV